MKRTAFFLLMLFTFYVAAMYYSRRMMGFFLAEVLLSMGMWILSCYLKWHVKAETPEQSIVGEGTGDLWWSCNLTNTGKLPVRSFRIPVQVRYRQETKGKRRMLPGVLEGKSEVVRYGIQAPYCGLLYLEMKHILIYDYLGLFPGRIPFPQVITAAILPPRQLLSVEFLSSGWSEKASGQERPIPYGIAEHDEIRQFHEYRTGDSSRHIHWIQSARTDRIWVKEYEKETDTSVSLLLDIDREHWKNSKRMDAFYRLLYAMVLGMLQKADTVNVYWYEETSGQLAESVVGDEKQCQSMMLALYGLDCPKMTDMSLVEADICKRIGSCYFRLDSGLSWYWGEEKIYQFSPVELEQEIAGKVFAL